MSKVWIYQLMNDSIQYCDQEGLQRQKDLIESIPFGLIKSVFANCVTVVQVIERATYVIEEMDDCFETSEDPDWEPESDFLYEDSDSAREFGLDDDPDWYDGSPVIPLHKIN